MPSRMTIEWGALFALAGALAGAMLTALMQRRGQDNEAAASLRDDLIRRIEQLDGRVVTLEGEHDADQGRIVTLQKELLRAQEAYADTKRAMQERVGRLETRIAELERENTTLKARLQCTVDECPIMGNGGSASAIVTGLAEAHRRAKEG